MSFVFHSITKNLDIGTYAKFVNGVFVTGDAEIAGKLRTNRGFGRDIWEASAIMETAEEEIKSSSTETQKKKAGRPKKAAVAQVSQGIKTSTIGEQEQ